MRDAPARPTRITADVLRRHEACPEQVTKFVAVFGAEGALLTPETWQRAIDAGLDVLWCGALLPRPLWDAYDAQVKTLWDAYDAQVKTPWDAYNAQVKRLLYRCLAEHFGEGVDA